jgi:cytochrome c oxidase assembly protein subunit 11
MSVNAPVDPNLRRRHGRVALACAAFTLSMIGAAYASVPLYDLFCRLTGFGGSTVVAEGLPERVIDRRFEIRFDANIHAGLPWTFTPEAPSISIRGGEVKTFNYTITNTSDRETWGIASYNVTPEKTGGYFAKIQCFCFTEQRLGPGESMELPVVFFVDPEIDKDRNTDSVKTITLSYTFFAAKPPATPVAAASSAETPRL